ncbi:MAG: hypothetical protein IT573_08890 [Deltaproteobacteria bacterium]|nr:hypothetical protein [Deltaproteobacteria bacterium]
MLILNPGMGTAAKSLHSTPAIEEFLGYDSRGQAVVLRRSSEHPGDPAPAPEPAEKKSEFRLASSTGDRSATAGGLGFFSEFQEVRKRLKAQGLLKR